MIDLKTTDTFVMELMGVPREFELLLTGSRFFGNSRPLSDWDFFCSVSDASTKWLLENGFRRSTEGLMYPDVNTADVWQHNRFAVHVQVQRPGGFQAKKTVQQVAKNCHLCPPLRAGSSDGSKWWNTMFAIYTAGMCDGTKAVGVKPAELEAKVQVIEG